MMTLFILFAVLFVWHSANGDAPLASKRINTALSPAGKGSRLAEKNQGRGEDLRQISSLYRMSQDVLKAEHLEGLAAASLVDGKTVRIVLTSDILFDSGEAELRESAVEVLGKLGALVRETPYTVTVAGHTDNVPINTKRFSSNWELSAARACVTARFLIDHRFVSPSQVRVTAYAEFHPVHPNDNDLDRALNRRVEICISKEDLNGSPSPHALPANRPEAKSSESANDLFFFDTYSLFRKESKWMPEKRSECSVVSS